MAKRDQEWQRIRRGVWEMFSRWKAITVCELRISQHCTLYYNKSFAHRHKRRWYYDKPELLGDFNQVILACTACHDMIEYDRELSDEVFRQLRDEREKPTGYIPLDYEKLHAINDKVKIPWQ